MIHHATRELSSKLFRQGPVLLLAVVVMLGVGARPAAAGPCKTDGTTCNTDASCCGTNGRNGVCVRAQGAKFGACCTKSSTDPGDTTCDGRDENCNGVADDGYASTSTTCAAGTCAGTGTTSCLNGRVVDSCAPFNPATFPGCGCSGAHCVPGDIVPAALQPLLSSCTDGLCAPDPVIRTGGELNPPNCIAFAGTTAAGRCLSACLPGIAAQPLLQQSTCAGGERCAPCADPFTGTNTGWCGVVGCDEPAPPSPFTFPGCCGDLGVCVPRSVIPDSEEESFGQRDCPTGPASYLCVNRDQAPSCHVDLSPIPPNTWDSVCVPDCVIGDQAVFLPRGGCPANWSCPPPF